MSAIYPMAAAPERTGALESRGGTGANDLQPDGGLRSCPRARAHSRPFIAVFHNGRAKRRRTPSRRTSIVRARSAALTRRVSAGRCR